jgi:hypothetical protein
MNNESKSDSRSIGNRLALYKKYGAKIIAMGLADIDTARKNPINTSLYLGIFNSDVIITKIKNNKAKLSVNPSVETIITVIGFKAYTNERFIEFLLSVKDK